MVPCPQLCLLYIFQRHHLFCCFSVLLSPHSRSQERRVASCTSALRWHTECTVVNMICAAVLKVMTALSLLLLPVCGAEHRPACGAQNRLPKYYSTTVCTAHTVLLNVQHWPPREQAVSSSLRSVEPQSQAFFLCSSAHHPLPPPPQPRLFGMGVNAPTCMNERING